MRARGRLEVCALTVAVVLGLALTTLPARAQMYDPAYPVCLQSYGIQSGISCRYASMGQCKVAASGRPAQCIANPYYAKRRR